MRVMGVDPGLTRCGLSVVEHRGGRQIIALDVDVVRTPADVPLPRRLLAISEPSSIGWTPIVPTSSRSSGCSPSRTCRR